MISDRKLRYRAAALMTALCLLFACGVPTLAASVSDFDDVSAGAWYYDAVSYVVGKGLFNGTTGSKFEPAGTMTRGMFITVLGRYAGVEPDRWKAATVATDRLNVRSGPSSDAAVVGELKSGDNVTLAGESGEWYRIDYSGQTAYVMAEFVTPSYHRFSDVNYDAYYAGYAIWGYEAGIVNGMGSADVFAPGGNVTREQICKLLHGYASYAGASLAASGSAVTFADQSSISGWAAAGVAAMQQAGVVVGEKKNGGNYFSPGRSATRAEAAAIFQRFDAAVSGVEEHAAETAQEEESVSFPQDTPAAFRDGGVWLPARTMRIGIQANTVYYSEAVSAAALENLSGYGFEYGYFSSDRSFVKSGDIGFSSITVTADGSAFTVKNSEGTTVYSGTGDLAIHPVSPASGGVRLNGGYSYRGDFELRQAYNAAGYITVINYVDIEDYVKGVLPYEFGSGWPSEALKAGAVAVRNYVMTADWSIYSGFGFDVMGNSSDQEYHGRGSAGDEGSFAATDAAADATANIYLTSGGYLARSHYFPSDGGATEDAEHVWGGAYSYLIGKKDPYELSISDAIPNWTYSITFSRTGETMRSILSAVGLSDVAPDGIQLDVYPATGNVRGMTLTSTNGSKATIDGYSSFGRWDFLSALGFTIYSFRYSVSYNASDDTFTCTRRGFGNQVGMSKWGAYAMAQEFGKDYQTILGFYFDGAQLQYGA